MEKSKLLCFILFLLQCHVRLLDSYNVPCAFNTMCLCWIQDDEEFTKMDISCLGVQFARFPDVSVSYVAQLDIVNSGMQVLENDALVSSSGVEALGLMSNRLASIGEKSLVGVAGSLRSLDLSYNSLEEIPFRTLSSLKKLNWLNMHSNHLTSLDGDWGHVSETLTNGFFGDNSIIEIPKILYNFKNLLLLNLDGNDIKTIEDDTLPINLRTLSLNNNLLTNLPISICNLPKLTWLYLRGNSLKILELPEFETIGIELLDISDNLIESIKFKTTTNKTLNIKDLNISSNKLNVIPAYAFKYIDTRRLHISSNNISIIDELAFFGLENKLEYIDIGNNGLKNVPIAIKKLKKLSYLYLSNNEIANITSDLFDEFSMNLRALSLSTNNLISMPIDALKNCHRLVHLNLGYNSIKHIFPGDFQWAESLEILLLRNNVISKLKSRTFKGAEHLKELSLSFNHLSELDDNAFIGVENSLEILELSFAFSIDIIPKKTLGVLINLLWLVMDNNNFHAIDHDTFYTFKKLRYINLESNRLHYLPDKLFQSNLHVDLRDVKFGYNFIELIPDYTFHDLNELRSLDLTGNRINYLGSNTIINCTKLVTISLAYNRIKVIHKNTFIGLYSLRFLHLEFNDITVLDFDAIVDSGGPEFSLNVSYNSISIINYDYGLINLTSLDIACNNITQLPSDCFDGTPNLKSLDLRGNYLTTVHPGTFALGQLETLNLKDNRLESLRKQAFHGCQLLQILDLSGNLISQLSNGQFRNLKNLRILNLSNNRLRTLPRDIFEGTRIELLDLSFNRISIVPSQGLIEIGYTLRDLNLCNNFIEHLDATTFPTSQLNSLNIARNRLTILPDNSFVSLSKLMSLNLSSNFIQANYKELFHYLPALRHLYMTHCGFRKVPVLQLTMLNVLDLSDNSIEAITTINVQYFESLKVLLLVNNSLTTVPDVRLHLLRELDLSGNPIEELNKDSFTGYKRLEKLILRKLNRIKWVDNDCLRVLNYLKQLNIQTWPNADGLDLRILLNGLLLRKVEIEVTERVLKNQIKNAFTRRLRELTITGKQLEAISTEAFSTIEGGELVLRIKDTHVRRFQSDIFLSLAKRMSQLTLDLRDNHINELSPSVIYGNLSWETVGTNLVSGGLQVSGNPLECDCEIAWLSLWLRRWLRESRQIHTASQSDARQLRNIAGRAVCTETTPSYSSDRVLLTLGTPHTACQASALSSANYIKSTKFILFFILLFIKFIIDCT